MTRPTPDAARVDRSALTAGALTAVAYAATLGWDRHRDLAADGSLHGPYGVGQVACLVLAVAAVSAWGGLRGRPGEVAAAVTGVLTALFVLSAMTEPGPGSDGLWPIGAALVLTGAGAGTMLVAHAADRVRLRRQWSRGR